MQGTHKFRPIEDATDARAPTPLLMAVALISAGLAYAALMAQPGLLRALTSVMPSFAVPDRAAASPWLMPAAAAGLALGGAAICLVVLSTFIRTVETAPYVWLSPLLVSFSSLVLARMHAELPLGLPQLWFVLVSGLLMLGGGALLSLRPLTMKFTGALVLLVPLLTTAAAYAQAHGGFAAAWRSLESGTALFLFVLSLTSFGVGLLALLGRGGSVETTPEYREQQLHLAHALERARLAEQAVNRTYIAGTAAQPSLRIDDTIGFVAAARPSISAGAVYFGCSVALAASLLTAYGMLYRPLARRLALQQALAVEAAREHAAEIEALRKRFELRQTTAPVAAAEAPRAAAGPAEVARVPAVAPMQAAHKPASVAKTVSAHAIAKRLQAAKPAAAPAPTRSAVARTPSERAKSPDNDSHGLKENVNDDPIGGLDTP